MPHRPLWARGICGRARPVREFGKSGAGHTLTLVKYRMLYLGLGSLLVAIVTLGIAFAPEGEQTVLPDPLEAVFPIPNNSVIRQTSVEVDLAVGYEATVYVDDFAIPPNEMAFSEGTNVYRWSPSPVSAVMSEWEPGEHTIRVEWVRITGAPLSGEFEWTFRVQ
jgi:hypothetical protein